MRHLVGLSIALAAAITLATSAPLLGQEADAEAIDRRPELLSHLGGPDAFVIEAAEVEGELVRFESWSYFDAATQIDLADGEILWSVEIDELPDGALFPLHYDPAMFELLATQADVRAALPDVELTRVKVNDGRVRGAVFLAGEQLVLGFVDDRLVYAETFPLVPEDEP